MPNERGEKKHINKNKTKATRSKINIMRRED